MGVRCISTRWTFQSTLLQSNICSFKSRNKSSNVLNILSPGFAAHSGPTRLRFSLWSPAAGISTTVKSHSVKKPELCNNCPELKDFPPDTWTTVNPKVLSFLGRNLHLQPYHPLCHVKKQIVDFTYKYFPRTKGGKSPLFTVVENLSPIVTVEQNFDSLLVPKDHISRSKSDSYYFNEKNLLRAHTSAHQSDLIASGLSNFLVIGDVYRRDEIDRTHYPVFHQIDAVRLVSPQDVFQGNGGSDLEIFERTEVARTPEKQEFHTYDAVKVLSHALKTSLEALVQHLFGKDVETRWVDVYFPFTHPSWELEINFNGEWMEVLGCGIMEQTLLRNAGAGEKIGWAYGMGLERLAMKLYQIPDIRLFWTLDSGFLHQFHFDDPYTPITYKKVSQYPSCINDISFWIPEDNSFTSNDFYDLVRSVGGDLVEQVQLVDEFHHLKKKRWSHCYRIVYRHMEKTLTQGEVNVVHKLIEEATVKSLGCELR